MPPQTAPDAPEFPLTIEQLAAATGMTVRNIRSHRARGLLAPPEVRDRVGYYGPDHVARLRMIKDLQADGLNLKGIKLLLERTGADSPQLARLKRAVTAPFETEEPEVYTVEELAERFGAVEPDVLAKAEKAGALVFVGEGRYEAPAPSLIEAAEEVVGHGVPLDHALTVLLKVDRRCAEIADEFVRLFLTDLWKPFAAAGYPEERWEEVAGSIDRLRPLSSRAVLAVYQLTMSQAVEKAFGKELKRLTGS
jgi:DNA-binding transcriptional MerR regulator